MKVEEVVRIKANNVSTLIGLIDGRKVPIMISRKSLRIRKHKPKLNTWSQVLRFWFDLV